NAEYTVTDVIIKLLLKDGDEAHPVADLKVYGRHADMKVRSDSEMNTEIEIPRLIRYIDPRAGNSEIIDHTIGVDVVSHVWTYQQMRSYVGIAGEEELRHNGKFQIVDIQIGTGHLGAFTGVEDSCFDSNGRING